MTVTGVDKSKYMEDFAESALELAKTHLEKCPPVEERIKKVDEMVEEYFNVMGIVPAGRALDNLSSYILIGDLKSRDVDKVANTDYPILSDTQVKRRDRKQITMESDTMDFLNSKFNREMDTLAKTPNRKSDL